MKIINDISWRDFIYRLIASGTVIGGVSLLEKLIY